MSSKKQIADLNASVTLYAKQYIDEMMRVGKVTKTTTDGMGRHMRSAAKSTQMLNSAQVSGRRSGQRYGVVMQQAGYQVQDFAVQVAGGQSALVALSQQGSQMLGVFGPGGAIAGAALGVGVLVSQIMQAGKEAKGTTEELRSLEEIMESIQKRGADLEFSRADSSGKKSILAGNTQELLSEQADLARQSQGLRFQLRKQEEMLQAALGSPQANTWSIQREITRIKTEMETLSLKGAELAEELQKVGETEIGVNETQARETTSRIKEMMQITKAYADEQNAAAESRRKTNIDRLADIAAEGAALEKSLRTPTELYNEELARLNELLRQGAINQDTFGRAAERAAQKLAQSTKETRKLRTEILSVEQIARAGGSSSNATKARRAMDIREQATAAEARGNFSYADKLYARADDLEGRINRRERTFDAATGAPVASAANVSTGAPSPPAKPPSGASGSGKNELTTIRLILEDLRNQVGVA